jgi:hypothetical protein
MNAYDYDEQRWLQGESARQLRLRQLREELELLSGPRGADYAAFLNVHRLGAVVGAQRMILELERSPQPN